MSTTGIQTNRVQITTESMPTTYEGRQHSPSAWRSEPRPFPRLGYLLVEARKASARGDKVEADRLWREIEDIRASKRANTLSPTIKPL